MGGGGGGGGGMGGLPLASIQWVCADVTILLYACAVNLNCWNSKVGRILVPVAA